MGSFLNHAYDSARGTFVYSIMGFVVLSISIFYEIN